MDRPLLSVDQVQILQGSAVGITLHALLSRKTLNWWAAVILLVSGGSLAWFGTPIVQRLLGWPSSDDCFIAIMLAFSAPFVFGGLITAGSQFQTEPFVILKSFLPKRWCGPWSEKKDN